MANLLNKINIKNSNIPIGGNNFNGQWVNKYSRIITNGTLAANGGYKSFSLSSYLPNDGCAYEVMIEAWGKNAAATGEITFSAGIGTNSSPSFHSFISCALNTYYGVARMLCGCIILPVPANNKNIVFVNSGADTLSLTSWSANLNGYRRIGTNTTGNNNYISKIQTPDKVIHTIGGGNFDGQWVQKWNALYNTTSLAGGADISISLSSYLPNDGKTYEVLFYIEGLANGGTTNIALQGDISQDFSLITCEYANNTNCPDAATIRIPVGIGRKIRLKNTSSSVKTGSIAIRIVAYRRLGTNQ